MKSTLVLSQLLICSVLRAQNQPPIESSGKANLATPTPTPIAAPSDVSKVSSSVSNAESDEAYSKSPSFKNVEFNPSAMHFLPEKNGAKIGQPKLIYSVDQDSDIEVSQVVIGSDTFRVNMGPLKVLGRPRYIAWDPDSVVIFATIPLGLGQQGTLEVLSEDGKALYSKTVQEEHIEHGRYMAETLPPEYWRTAKKDQQLNLLIPAEELRESIINSDRKSGFRFCWSQKQLPYYSKYCTPYYRYSKKDQRTKVQTQTGATKIFIDQKEMKNADSLDIDPNKPKRFLATSSKGFSAEFYSQPNPLLLIDFYLDESKKWIYLIGHTFRPSWPASKFFPAIDPKSFVSYLMWTPTIAQQKDHWITVIPKNNAQILLPGKGGGLFTYSLEISKAPSSQSRIILKKPLKSTYSSKPVLRASISKSASVTPIPPGKIKLSANNEELSWQFNAQTKGEDQVGGLIVKEEGNEFQSFYSLYRGYAGEFSLRIAGVVSADLQLNLLGEAAYNQWFETLLGWENPYLAFQRWGISAKHFAPLKTFTPKGSASAPLTMNLTTFDIKYRFTPGLWERDETWGLIFGFEDVSINSFKGSFLGAGLFWARSMPEIFDRIMNWIPFMSYPKWVDMEMIYYASSLKKTVLPGSQPNYAVNFHGKILWSKALFGEAGFGLKSYNYILTDIEQQVRLQTLYGTAGIGLNF